MQCADANERVSVLCSIDVLKMRSEHFYDILLQQENADNHQSCHENDNTICSSLPPIVVVEVRQIKLVCLFVPMNCCYY